jgi:uncharacterized damage-inducible protein DinB
MLSLRSCILPSSRSGGESVTNAAGEFKRHWEFVHMMTRDFVSSVPDAHWEFSPHARFAPFCKQLRHVICVRGLYNETIENGHADWSRKHQQYSGDLTRASLVQALQDKNEAMLATLDRLEKEGGHRLVEFIGRQMHLGEFAQVIVHHEALHQGQWSLYASLAGFDTPHSWRLNWGL